MGGRIKICLNPNGVVANLGFNVLAKVCHNRVAVGGIRQTITQGSSFLPTLGFGSESRWDSVYGFSLV